MMSTYNPTFRGSQNPETPDLPFGQTAWSGYQGISYAIQPDRAPYPIFQQVGQRRAPKFDYILNGTSLWYGEFIDKRMRMTESLANTYRGIGYKVVKVSPEVEPEVDPEQTNDTPITPTKAQVLSIIKDEYGDDIALLHANSVKLGDALRDAQVHRNEIESKVGNSLVEHQEFHTKLSSLGKSVTDVSTALEAHKIGHNGWNPFGDLLPLVLIGGVVIYLATSKKRKG